MDPQLILGLPWIIREKPVIEWETGTLVFPSKAQWSIAEEVKEPISQLGRTWDKIYLILNGQSPQPPHTHSSALCDIEGSIGEEEEAVTPLVMPSWVEGLVTANESIFAPLEGISSKWKNKTHN